MKVSSLITALKQRHVFDELPRTADVERAASTLFGEMARCHYVQITNVQFTKRVRLVEAANFTASWRR